MCVVYYVYSSRPSACPSSYISAANTLDVYKKKLRRVCSCCGYMLAYIRKRYIRAVDGNLCVIVCAMVYIYRNVDGSGDGEGGGIFRNYCSLRVYIA